MAARHSFSISPKLDRAPETVIMILITTTQNKIYFAAMLASIFAQRKLLSYPSMHHSSIIAISERCSIVQSDFRISAIRLPINSLLTAYLWFRLRVTKYFEMKVSSYTHGRIRYIKVNPHARLFLVNDTRHAYSNMHLCQKLPLWIGL